MIHPGVAGADLKRPDRDLEDTVVARRPIRGELTGSCSLGVERQRDGARRTLVHNARANLKVIGRPRIYMDRTAAHHRYIGGNRNCVFGSGW